MTTDKEILKKEGIVQGVAYGYNVFFRIMSLARQDEAKKIFEKLDKAKADDLGTPARGKNRGRVCFVFPIADYNELKKECGVK